MNIKKQFFWRLSSKTNIPDTKHCQLFCDFFGYVNSKTITENSVFSNYGRSMNHRSVFFKLGSVEPRGSASYFWAPQTYAKHKKVRLSKVQIWAQDKKGHFRKGFWPPTPSKNFLSPYRPRLFDQAHVLLS